MPVARVGTWYYLVPGIAWCSRKNCSEIVQTNVLRLCFVQLAIQRQLTELGR